MPYIQIFFDGAKTFGGYLSIDNGKQIELVDQMLIKVNTGVHHLKFASLRNASKTIYELNTAIGGAGAFIGAMGTAGAVDGEKTVNFNSESLMEMHIVSSAGSNICSEPVFDLYDLTDEGIKKLELLYEEQTRAIAEAEKNAASNGVIELVLCLCLGTLGVHKFYVGKIGMGILYLFTFGLFGIGVIVDLISIITRLIKARKANG